MKTHRFVTFFAVVLVVLIFLLILWGGVVHNTGSSLACPDWPTCYGSLMPEMKGGIAIEHGHRLLASAVGLLSIGLAILLHRYRKDLKGWGLFAVGLVVFQGVLGGITVIFRLPTAVSTAHLATAFLFLALILYLAWNVSEVRSLKGIVQGRGWIKLAATLVYLQSVLGAFMRHTGAGLVCPDLPFCYGSPWPVDRPAILLLHMAHRWMGVLVGLVVLAIPMFVRADGRPWVKGLSWLAPFLVVIQIALGAASVWTQLGVVSVTAHLGVAALLWMVLVSLWILTLKTAPAAGRSDLLSRQSAGSAEVRA